MLQPLQKVVRELEPNWQPRYPAYWQRTMEYLPPLRQAVQACCSLFERGERSQECPLPIGMIGNHLPYRFALSSIEHEFEEAGILLTSHSAASYSQEVGHIRQRQQVLKALRTLCEAGQKAISEGRARLDALPAEQEAFLESCQPRAKRRAARATTARARTALQVLGQNGEAPGTVVKGEDS